MVLTGSTGLTSLSSASTAQSPRLGATVTAGNLRSGDRARPDLGALLHGRSTRPPHDGAQAAGTPRPGHRRAPRPPRSGGTPDPVPDLTVMEVSRDDPGRQAVLDRLLDLSPLSTLREWFTRQGGRSARLVPRARRPRGGGRRG
ncbi:cupin domain-containing protein [Streptomyces sp. NPDC054849]